MDRMKPKNKELTDEDIMRLRSAGLPKELTRLCLHIANKEKQSGIKQGEKQEREKIVKMLKDRVKDVKFCQSQDKYQEQIEEDDIIIGEDKWIIQQITNPAKEER